AAWAPLRVAARGAVARRLGPAAGRGAWRGGAPPGPRCGSRRVARWRSAWAPLRVAARGAVALRLGPAAGRRRVRVIEGNEAWSAPWPSGNTPARLPGVTSGDLSTYMGPK